MVETETTISLHCGTSSEGRPGTEPDALSNHGQDARATCDFVLDEDEYGEFCVVPVYGGYYAKIDPEDYEEISRHRWFILKHGKKPAYARRSISIIKDGRKKVITVLMHRQIMKVEHSIFLDHINGDGFDNRKGNLRVADTSQNQWNQKPRVATSKYKGVAWDKRAKKWAVRICYKYKHIWLGFFDDELEAARAYDEAAKKYFGVFARLNFPVDSTSSLLKEAKMSYCLDEQTKKKTTKKILELKHYSNAELAEILANMSVTELGDMCRVLQCNISELSKKIRKGIIP